MENTSFSNTDAEPGVGFSYPEPLRVFFIIAGMACLLIGVPGNLLIIFTILKFKHLRVRLNMFIVNLALSDLVIGGYILPFLETDYITGRQPGGMMLCRLNVNIIQTALSAGFLSLVFIAVSRYMKVCKNRLYVKLFTKTSITIMCILSWALGLLFGLYLIINPTHISYNKALHVCSLDPVKARTVGLISACVKFPPAYVATFWCYYKIWKHVRDSDYALRNNGNETFSRIRQNSDRSVFKSNFVVFLLFVILQTPFAIFVFAIPSAPVGIQGFSAILFMTNSSVNFIIYGTMNKNIRKCYGDLIPLFRRLQIRPEQIQNSRSVPSTASTMLRSVTEDNLPSVA